MLIAPNVQVSLFGNWNCDQEEVYGYCDHFIPDPWGLSKVVDLLAAETFTMPNDTRLRLKEPVTDVHFDLENDSDVPSDLPREGVYVKTATGEQYWARYCIITFTVRPAPHSATFTHGFWCFYFLILCILYTVFYFRMRSF